MGVEKLGRNFDGRCSLDGVPVKNVDGFLVVIGENGNTIPLE